jgi:hypothetical protein
MDFAETIIAIPNPVKYGKKKLTADGRRWTQINTDKFLPQ